MAQLNGNNRYIQELKKAIKDRTGEECPTWLMPLVRSTAMNMILLDKIQDELERGELTTIEIGSQSQPKRISNPLLVAYKECQRTISLQLEKLGLTYSATPSKITENTRKGVDESDPMMKIYEKMDIL